MAAVSTTEPFTTKPPIGTEPQPWDPKCPACLSGIGPEPFCPACLSGIGPGDPTDPISVAAEPVAAERA